MDDRVSSLLDAYPQIFEKFRPLGEFDDEFVVINVPVGSGPAGKDPESKLSFDPDTDDVLGDEEYWEPNDLAPSNWSRSDPLLEYLPWVWLRDLELPPSDRTRSE